MQEREQRCGTCAHAHKYEYQPRATSIMGGMPDSYVKIECRRFPPVVTYVDTLREDPIAAWPSMQDTDRCGEWKGKPLDKAG